MGKKKEAPKQQVVKGSSDNARRSNQVKDGFRSASTVKRLKMYRQRPIRNKDGKLVKGELMSREAPKHARVAPDRRWFGNTRVIGQEELEKFRDEMKAKVNDSYTVVLKQKALPLSLLKDSAKTTRMNLLSVESFADTFGPGQKRKKPKISVGDLDSLASKANTSTDSYDVEKDSNIKQELDYTPQMKEPVFEKGQSRRIFGELHKVIDSSDVIVQVLDARDPMGTRSKYLESFLKKKGQHKHLLLVLNKCDLVPTWVTSRWVKILSEEYPTLAFHASITNPFGKGSLIHLLRQFSRLHRDKKNISVGFVGYPNVGKSSLINTLRGKKVCNVAPIPGETKVWQYITLFKKIFLVDCPGVVYNVGDSETDTVLKGVVRVENIGDATEHIVEVLKRVKKEYIVRTYGISDWTDHIDFLTQFSKKSGRLLKKGEPDLNTSARMILNDWQRGKIPFFVPPPADPNAPSSEIAEEGDATESQNEKFQLKQRFEKIRVQTAFTEEDAEAGASEVQPTEADEPDWDEVFKNISAKDVTAEEIEDGGDDGPETPSIKSDAPTAEGEDSSVTDEDEAAEADAEEHSGVEETTSSGDEEKAQGPTSKGAAQKLKAARGSTEIPAKKTIEKKAKGKLVHPPKPGMQTKKGKKAMHVTGDGSGDEDSKRAGKKEKRMTTNKKKAGVHYYETANVKNKRSRKSG
eukprot:tig00000194_g14770.t1